MATCSRTRVTGPARPLTGPGARPGCRAPPVCPGGWARGGNLPADQAKRPSRRPFLRIVREVVVPADAAGRAELVGQRCAQDAWSTAGHVDPPDLAAHHVRTGARGPVHGGVLVGLP